MTEKKSKYSYKKKSAWDIFTKQQIDQAFKYAEEYKQFLNEGKTEREVVAQIKKLAEQYKKKVYHNRESSAAIIIPGKKPLDLGIRLIIAHIDTPRLDLKQVPLFEDADSNVALFETHYYGGIKKFQWLTIPLALHGVIVTKNGKKRNIKIGEKSVDPVFSVPDLLPHLSHEVQDTKKMDEAIKGESLDIVVGSRPVKEGEKEKIKTALLQKLHSDLGIIEEDFISSELEAVPVFQARDMGFDRSLVIGYGQDDRASAFAALKAILGTTKPEHMAMVLFVDKEEIGSEGNASAQATIFLRSIIRQLDANIDVDSVLFKSKVISADVNAAITPNYTDVFELKNASSLGYGVVMSKYTGHRGKFAANDASAEYVAEIRKLLNMRKIPWQTGELGKVEKGGGGTVAKFFARLGMEVIDLGPPVMCMHAPFEVTSKVDLYSSYLAYQAFLTS